MDKELRTYQAKAKKITGRSYSDVQKVARATYNAIAKLTKRNAYVRSAYFNKDKVFLKPFWEHVMQKHEAERKRRLRYYNAAIELLRKSTLNPETIKNPNGSNEWLHRFKGATSEGDAFFVQVKHDIKTGNKYFMSVFPMRKK